MSDKLKGTKIKSRKYAIEPRSVLCYLKSRQNKLSWQWEGMTFPVDAKEIRALTCRDKVARSISKAFYFIFFMNSKTMLFLLLWLAKCNTSSSTFGALREVPYLVFSKTRSSCCIDLTAKEIWAHTIYLLYFSLCLVFWETVVSLIIESISPSWLTPKIKVAVCMWTYLPGRKDNSSCKFLSIH